MEGLEREIEVFHPQLNWESRRNKRGTQPAGEAELSPEGWDE